MRCVLIPHLHKQLTIEVVDLTVIVSTASAHNVVKREKKLQFACKVELRIERILLYGTCVLHFLASADALDLLHASQRSKEENAKP
jgi:hypothetical protein